MDGKVVEPPSQSFHSQYAPELVVFAKEVEAPSGGADVAVVFEIEAPLQESRLDESPAVAVVERLCSVTLQYQAPPASDSCGL